MALVTRRIALAVVAVGSMLASFVLPATSASASSVPVPTLVSPASSSTTPLKDVVLQWNPVPGASQYEVQISPNNEWTNNAVTLPDGGLTVNTVYEVAISLPHASYFWHVRAMVGGVWSAYSAPRHFLRAWPTGLAIIKEPTSADPTIEWTPISEASLYVVTFTDTTSSAGTTLMCDTEQTSFTPYVTVSSPTSDALSAKPAPIAEDLDGECFGESGLVAGDSYLWGIEAIDDSTAPAVTAEDTNGDPLACLTVVPECGGYVGDTYVSPTDLTFEAPSPVGTFDPTSTATGLTTSWRPSSTTAGNSCDTATYCPVTPTFSWNPTPGANLYRVDVYLDPLHTNDYRTYETAWPELTPRDFYLDAQAGAWYYWTVQPMFCQTACTAPSTSVSCSAGSAGADTAAITSPGSASVPAGSSTSITIVEPTVVGVTANCVQVSNGTVTAITSRGIGSITFTYQAPADAGSVTLLVLNNDGSTSQQVTLTITDSHDVTRGVTSAPQSFGKRSGAVTPVAPVNGSTLHGGSVTFRWADFLTTGGVTALEARNYELEVSHDSNFDSTVIDVSDIDLTQFTNPEDFLANGSYYWRVIAIDESGKQLTWSPTYHFTVDATTPTVSFLTANGVAVSKQLQIQTSARLTGIKTSTLKVVPEGKSLSYAVAGKITPGATSKMYTFTPDQPLGTGVTYVLVPMPSLVDGNGNPVVVTGTGVTTTLTAKATSRGWHYSGGWVKYPTSGALSGHGFVYTAGAGRQASLTVGGSEAHLFACIGPDFGRITVSVGGHSKTISEHQKGFTTCGVEIWHRALPATSRKLTVSVVSGFGDIDEVQVDPISGTTT